MVGPAQPGYSVGCQVSIGRFGTKCAACSPVPAATSSTSSSRPSSAADADRDEVHNKNTTEAAERCLRHLGSAQSASALSALSCVPSASLLWPARTLGVRAPAAQSREGSSQIVTRQVTLQHFEDGLLVATDGRRDTLALLYNTADRERQCVPPRMP
eukprot:SAG11_NODE_3431_length_2451_cov_1.535714_2_plen_157_part_00